MLKWKNFAHDFLCKWVGFSTILKVQLTNVEKKNCLALLLKFYKLFKKLDKKKAKYNKIYMYYTEKES